MGPASAAQIDALNQMTGEQLTTYVSLWKTKNTQVTAEATWELESLRLETAAKIVELKDTAELQLETYKSTWRAAMKAVNADTRSQLEDLKANFDSTMYGISTSTEASFTALGNNVQTVLNNANPGIVGAVSNIAANINNVMLTSDWNSTGQYIVDGIIVGIESKTNELRAAVRAMAAAAEAAANKQLDINSPSGVFEDVGMYSVLGFIKGLKSLGSEVSSTAAGVGQSALNGINSVISKIVDTVTNETDCTPVITPVLDLASIQNGMKDISDILNTENTLATTIATDKKSQGINSEKQNSTEDKAGTSYQFVQNNYSPKALSRIELYRQTKNQFSAVKAQVEGI